MKLSNKFILKQIGKDTMLLPINNDYMSVKNLITLNETSLTIYNLLKEGLAKEDIILKMLEEYDIDKETLSRDVEDVIAKFIALGVLDV